MAENEQARNLSMRSRVDADEEDDLDITCRAGHASSKLVFSLKQLKGLTASIMTEAALL